MRRRVICRDRRFLKGWRQLESGSIQLRINEATKRIRSEDYMNDEQCLMST